MRQDLKKIYILRDMSLALAVGPSPVVPQEWFSFVFGDSVISLFTLFTLAVAITWRLSLKKISFAIFICYFAVSAPKEFLFWCHDRFYFYTFFDVCIWPVIYFRTYFSFQYKIFLKYFEYVSKHAPFIFLN